MKLRWLFHLTIGIILIQLKTNLALGQDLKLDRYFRQFEHPLNQAAYQAPIYTAMTRLLSLSRRLLDVRQYNDDHDACLDSYYPVRVLDNWVTDKGPCEEFIDNWKTGVEQLSVELSELVFFMRNRIDTVSNLIDAIDDQAKNDKVDLSPLKDLFQSLRYQGMGIEQYYANRASPDLAFNQIFSEDSLLLYFSPSAQSMRILNAFEREDVWYSFSPAPFLKFMETFFIVDTDQSKEIKEKTGLIDKLRYLHQLCTNEDRSLRKTALCIRSKLEEKDPNFKGQEYRHGEYTLKRIGIVLMAFSKILEGLNAFQFDHNLKTLQHYTDFDFTYQFTYQLRSPTSKPDMTKVSNNLKISFEIEGNPTQKQFINFYTLLGGVSSHSFYKINDIKYEDWITPDFLRFVGIERHDNLMDDIYQAALNNCFRFTMTGYMNPWGVNWKSKSGMQPLNSADHRIAEFPQFSHSALMSLWKKIRFDN